MSARGPDRFDPTSEQYVIAAALQNQDLLDALVERVKPDDCYASLNRVIWDVLGQMSDDDLAFDIGTFARVASEMGYADADWGGDEYIENLIDAYDDVDESNVEYHIRQSRSEARFRVLAEEEGEDLLAEMRRPGATPSEISAAARAFTARVTGIANGSSGDALATSGEDAAEAYARVLARRAAGRSDNVPFGLGELDVILTWGALESKVTAVVARTSVGKSAFGYNLAKWRIDMCTRGRLDDPRPVLSMPLEMGTTSFIDGLVSRAARVPCDDLIKNFAGMDLNKKMKVDKARTDYVGSEWISYFDEPAASITRVEEILASAMEDDPNREGERRTRYGLVLWDLFDKSLDDLDNKTIAMALNRAQALAKRYKTHLVLFAQIRRGGERRSDKRPTREEIKGSGGWEESCDQIIALHREAVYDPDIEDDDMEIGVLKQKMGAFGQWLTYEYDAATFTVLGLRDASHR